MDWITDKIAIGNYIDGSDAEAIRSAGFRSILCLDRQLPAPEGLVIRREVIHLQDSPAKQLESFLKAVTTLETLVNAAGPVLVHCHAGRSRSVVVTAAFFMRAKNLEPDQALAFVASKRETAVTPGVEQLLFYI